MQFPWWYKIQCPQKWPFKLEALYHDIHASDAFKCYISEIIIVYCGKEVSHVFEISMDVFLLLLKVHSSWKTLEMLPIEINQNFKNLRHHFVTTTLLFQTNLSPSPYCSWLSRHRNPKSGYKGFFESKIEWVSQNNHL